MKICLNGNIYELQAGTEVTRRGLQDWPDNIRLDGQQKRKDRRLLSSWAIDAWHNGLGIQRQNTDLASHEYRLWDVDGCDTRQPASIVLSPALNTCTIVPSRGDLDLAFTFLNNIYFAETQRVYEATSGSLFLPNVHQFIAPNTLGSPQRLGVYTNVGGPSTMSFGSLSGIAEVNGKIAFTLMSKPQGGFGLTGRFYSVTALSGALPGGSGGIHTSVLGADIIPPVQIAEMGGTVHIVSYHSINQVNFWLSDNQVATAFPVGSIACVVGTYLPELQTDGLTMYAQTPKGIYDFDATPALAVDTSRAQDLNGAQVMFQNYLYFKNKKSLIKYDGTDTISVGYDQEDGLPAEQFGEITAMCSSWKSIFAAVKGASYSHILSMDVSNKWQYYARIPSMGLWVKRMFLSDAPDAIDRLWLIFGNHPFPGYFLNPMVSPLQAGTYAFVPTGYFEKPEFDGGMPEELGAFYDMNVTADGIGGDNKITCLYGLNGANAVTTLGVVATTSLAHIYGSPYGVEGYRIKPRFILHGANSGTTPQFRSAVVHYLKIPETRESFEFTVDLLQTATERRNPLEAVIGSLNSERDKRTLMPFWYGQIGTKAVKVIDMPGLENVELDKIYSGERKGFIRIQLAEIL